jgi:hypothetical protein
VLVLLGCSALYLGAGVAHAVKGRGVPLSAGAMQLVPHAESWVALWGLVQDGCAFTAARWTATNPWYVPIIIILSDRFN